MAHAREFRGQFLQSEGYRILRFWNNEVLENLDGVLETTANELRRVTPTPPLPHQGGGRRATYD